MNKECVYKYEGNFVYGSMDGEGTLYIDNVLAYKGSFKDNKFEG